MTVTQLKILKYCAKAKTYPQLIKLFDYKLTQGNLRNIVKRMVIQGWLLRISDGFDERMASFKTTPQGSELYQTIIWELNNEDPN